VRLSCKGLLQKRNRPALDEKSDIMEKICR
jgi:hypothetical protein